MNKLVAVSAVLLFTATLSSQEIQTLRKESGGIYIINTTHIGRKIEGYNGRVPLEVYIKDKQILKVVALGNEETPKFFRKVEKEVLPKFEGLDVKKSSKKLEVDATSGATLSSKAVIEQVKLALKYYQKNK